MRLYRTICDFGLPPEMDETDYDDNQEIFSLKENELATPSTSNRSSNHDEICFVNDTPKRGRLSSISEAWK